MLRVVYIDEVFMRKTLFSWGDFFHIPDENYTV